jgi:hypothetical protein
MDANMLPSSAEMIYKVVKRVDLAMVSPGKRSPLSKLRAQLQDLKEDDAVLIETDTPEVQRAVYRRMRSNVTKWHTRYGLKSVSVHLTKDGHVALYHKKQK